MSKITIALLVAFIVRDVAAQTCNCINGPKGTFGSFDHHNLGDCTAAEPFDGSSKCSLKCNTGYSGSGTNGDYGAGFSICSHMSPLGGTIYCNIKPDVCTANPCDCTSPSLFPTNGNTGNCSATQASGSACSPGCTTGYTETTQGVNTCTAGICNQTTAAVCTVSPISNPTLTPTAPYNTNDLIIGLCVGLGGFIMILLAIGLCQCLGRHEFPAPATQIEMKEEI